jgi:G3E family GTPase
MSEPEPSASVSSPLPVTIVGGYLGAGKTTLVNHLLREAAGRRLAVLVNDFGELPIDPDLIETVAGNVIGIAGGCVCCSYGSDLIAALEDLLQLAPRPDQVLIEASGVALPGAVASALTLVPGYVLDGILVLADAETVRQRAVDPYMADTVVRQLTDADLLVVNKTDLVDATTLAATLDWLADIAPGRPVLTSCEASIPPAVASGLPAAAGPGQASTGADPHAPATHHDTGGFATTSFEIDHPVDPDGLARGLAEFTPELLRAKGLLHDRRGVTMELQVVGRRWRAGPAAFPQEGPGRLVVIGRAGAVPTERLAALLERCRA